MSVLALTASALLVFAFGIIVGIWLLRWELARNGWRVRFQVDPKTPDESSKLR
jgi:hypothetical protein